MHILNKKPSGQTALFAHTFTHTRTQIAASYTPFDFKLPFSTICGFSLFCVFLVVFAPRLNAPLSIFCNKCHQETFYVNVVCVAICNKCLVWLFDFTLGAVFVRFYGFVHFLTNIH